MAATVLCLHYNDLSANYGSFKSPLECGTFASMFDVALGARNADSLNSCTDTANNHYVCTSLRVATAVLMFESESA